MSYDEKHKVGCVIVKDGNIISMGWNGTPPNTDNKTRIDGVTKREVIHSESNAIAKLAKTGGSSYGATIYCTHSPCWNCALLLLQSGIVRVVYDRMYDSAAAEFLKQQGVIVDGVVR